MTIKRARVILLACLVPCLAAGADVRGPIQVRPGPRLQLYRPVFRFDNMTERHGDFFESFHAGSASPYRFSVSLVRRDIGVQNVTVSVLIDGTAYPMALGTGDLLSGTSATYLVTPSAVKGCGGRGEVTYQFVANATTTEVIGTRTVIIKTKFGKTVRASLPIYRVVEERSPIFATKIDGAASAPFTAVYGRFGSPVGCGLPMWNGGWYVPLSQGSESGLGGATEWFGAIPLRFEGPPGRAVTFYLRAMSPAGYKVVYKTVQLVPNNTCPNWLVVEVGTAPPATLECEQELPITVKIPDNVPDATCLQWAGAVKVEGHVDGPEPSDFTVVLDLPVNPVCGT